MASSEPKKPSPPANGPAPATPPGSTLPCQKNPFKLVSETFATSPANRARTKIGVGEEVTIKTDPTVNAKWTLSGGGKLRTANGTQTVFEAGDTAGSATVTATGADGCTATITFTVVEPSNWIMKRRPGTNKRHTQGFPDNGFQASFYVQPKDVNFYRVEVRELDSTAVTTGCFDATPHKGAKHGNYPAPDFASGDFGITMTNHTDADGSLVNMVDNIYSGISSVMASDGSKTPLATPPFTSGTLVFPITFQWRVGTGTRKNFPVVEQRHTVTSDGTSTSSKGGHTESSFYTDPTTTP